MIDATTPGLNEDQLLNCIHEDLDFWLKGALSIRGCPINYEYKELVSELYSIPKNAKYPDPWYFVEVTDKNNMANPELDKELWLCWE